MDDITPQPVSAALIAGETGWQVDRHQPLAGPQSAVIVRRA